jgi:hypothetical protein
MAAALAVRGALAGAVAVVLLAGLGGCGSETTTLAASARDTQHQDVDAIRDAAKDDPAGAKAALARFRTHVDDLVAKDALDPADALKLIAHASRIEGRLPAPTPTPTPSRPSTGTSTSSGTSTSTSTGTTTRDREPATETVTRVAESTPTTAKGKPKGKAKGHGHH